MSVKKIIPFIVSLALHLGVFALLYFIAVKSSEILAPEGVYKKGGTEIVEVGVIAPVTATPKPPVHPALNSTGDISVAAKKSAAPSAPSEAPALSGLGHANGIASSGLLGESHGQLAGAKERYLYELHVLIEERKIYPVISRRLRESGRVLIQFSVEKDGTIKDVLIKQGTPYARLNEAARDLIAGVKKFKPLPEDFKEADAKLEIPIEYTLQ